MTVLREKIRDVIASVLPVAGFVLVLQLLFRPLSAMQTGRFIFASILIIIGMAIFLMGIDLSITPMGTSLGRGLVRKAKLPVILLSAFFLGFLINVAEPDLMILARSVDEVTQGVLPYMQLILIVSAGLGIMVLFGFLRLIKHIKLKHIFFITYAVILLLSLFCPGEYFAIAFDASGATTGAITTPFLLALSSGLSVMAFRSSDSETAESFGLVGLASSGAIMAVLFAGVLSGGGSLKGGGTAITAFEGGFFEPFLLVLGHLFKDALLAIGPLTLIFFVINAFTKDVRKRQQIRILKGIIYCIIGLTIFTCGVNGSFMEIGQLVGLAMAELGKPWLLVVIGFFLGMTTVLAEPAVHVLTQQIEVQTTGYIDRKLVLLFMSGGVAIAVALAMLRILIPGFALWHVLLPAYLAAIAMSFKSSELFTGISFDSGGVVSGPMTATFVLAFAQGAAAATPGADIIIDGFGIIALVAVSPLIALQILGLLYQKKAAKEVQNHAQQK